VIERGGRLLLTGAEIAYGLADQNNTGEDGAVRDTAFLHNRLHATYLGDDGGTSSVRGVGGDPVGNGALLSIEGGIPDNETPDLIEPRDGAIPIFYYSFADQRIAGIRYEKDGGRMIYLGFTIEGMGKASQRLDLMRRSIEWLTGTSSVDDAPEAAGDLLGTPWPNPASSAITVPIALKAPARARVELYDMRGALAAAMPERTFEAGINTVRIDCSGLPSGGYRVVVSSGGRVATAMVAVMP
jgi:hypothetical protein